MLLSKQQILLLMFLTRGRISISLIFQIKEMNHYSSWYARAGKWSTFIQNVILSDYPLTEIFNNILITLFILFNYNLIIHSKGYWEHFDVLSFLRSNWHVERHNCVLCWFTVIRIKYETPSGQSQGIQLTEPMISHHFLEVGCSD